LKKCFNVHEKNIVAINVYESLISHFIFFSPSSGNRPTDRLVFTEMADFKPLRSDSVIWSSKLASMKIKFVDWVSCYGSIEHAHSTDSSVEGNPHCQQEQLMSHISSDFPILPSTTMT
jgi:hypothetical protein